MPRSPDEPNTSRPSHSGGPSTTMPAKSRPGVRGKTAYGINPVAALTSDGLTPAALISTMTSCGPQVSNCLSMAGAIDAALAAFALRRSEVASNAKAPAGFEFAVAVVIALSSSHPRRICEACRQSNDLSRFPWRCDLAAEILDDTARLLDQCRVG